MGILSPTGEQIKAMIAMQDEGPIVMINLLKFKPDGGMESYQKYGEEFQKIMGPQGVEVIYQGKCSLTMIGHEKWDRVIVVKYPSRDVFIEMYQNKEYQEISKYRMEGLADSRLFLTKEG